MAKFSWDLTVQLIIWHVDPCEESEVTDARRYLAMEAERLEVQCNNTR
jgi:hypothetical protein